ncbi:MAG TPA: hypothetical protein VIP54_06625 [Microterricola sp.]
MRTLSQDPTKQNVYRRLKTLKDAVILASKSEHRRGTFWRSDEILGLLDAFAERSGRRG